MNETGSAVSSLLVSLLVVLCALSAACEKGTPAPPDPAAALRAIPAADAARYARVSDMKQWRNPYLIVKVDGVMLLDAADNAEIAVKTDDLLATLGRLPVSDWPYGRVVAVTENARRSSEPDGIAIRRNKGIVGGMLQGAGVAVRWVE